MGKLLERHKLLKLIFIARESLNSNDTIKEIKFVI